MVVWEAFFYLKGRIMMLPKTIRTSLKFCGQPHSDEEVYVRLQSYDFSVDSLNMVCFMNKGFACVCVCFLLYITPPLPTSRSLRAVPKCLILLFLGQAPLYRQVSLSLNLAGQNNLFFHSQDCYEGLDWD